jgi:long-chain acyl-CoA synthetase
MTDISDKIRASLDLGEQPAIKYEDRWFSWRELKSMAGAIDRLLDDQGLCQGARIGLLGRNRPAHMAAMFGLLATRRAVILINPFIAPERLAESIKSLALPAVIADEEDWSTGLLGEAASEIGASAIALHTDPDRPVATFGDHYYRKNDQTRPFADNCAMEMFTSGTTGEPKRITYSYSALTQAIEGQAMFAARMGEAPPSGRPEGSLIQYAPFVHISGLTTSLQMAAEGRRLMCLEKFTPEGWLSALAETGQWMGPLPPAMMRMLLEKNVPREALKTLRGVRSGGAALDHDTRQRFMDRFGIPILTVYGATEYGGPIAAWSLEDYREHWPAKSESTGRVERSIANVRIVDTETSRILPRGERGVLEVLVPRMSPEWMRTTDIASLDEDDFLYIHGRTDDAINRGGFKVLPEAVASLLRRHAAVSDAIVIGVVDDRLGQLPVAVVELRAGEPRPTEEELISYARQNLVRYQVPARILVVNELPRTSIGKINRVAIRAMFETDGTAN